MESASAGADRLISRREISELAGVRRETVTTWANRHADFPGPTVSEGADYFPLGDILAWLESRVIPVKLLRPHEAEGTTYADRVRHASADRRPGSLPADSSDTAQVEQTLTELLGPLADRVRGPGSQTDYLQFLLVLIFVRGGDPRRWAAARDLVAEAVQAQAEPGRVLRVLGSVADEALRERGLLPGARGVFERLRAETVEAVFQVFHLCDGLGREAFRLLLDRFESWTKPDSSEFFTPRGVVALTAGILLGDAERPLHCHDPYLRGGEGLAALTASGRRVTMSGRSPHADSLRLAGMNLALHGQKARLVAGTFTPWTDRDHLPPADRIFTNPPFNRKGESAQGRDEEWEFGPPPAANDNYAWLQHVIASLAPGGRAAVVMPNKAGVSANQDEHAIRRKMVEKGAVECVIALPSGLFPATPIAVTVWVLTPATGSRERMLFVDARKMGDKGRNQRFLSEEDRDAIVGCYHAWKTGQDAFPELSERAGTAISVPIEDVRTQDYSLNPSDYDRNDAGTVGGASTVPVPRPAARLTAFCEAAAQCDRAVGDLRVEERAPSEGPLPAGWRTVLLNELCDLQTGPANARLKSARPGKAGDVPIVVARHLRDRRVAADAPDLVSTAAAAELGRFRLAAHDILCVRTGTVGPVALVDGAQTDWLYGTNLIRLRPRPPARVDPGYLLGFLTLPGTQKWIKDRAATTTAIDSISTRALGRLQVPLPPPPEQHRIGSALRDLDRQITAHRDLAAAATRLYTDLADTLISGLLTVQ